MATAVEGCDFFVFFAGIEPQKGYLPNENEHPILVSVNEINKMYIGYPSPTHFHTLKRQANSIPLQIHLLGKAFLGDQNDKVLLIPDKCIW